MRLLKMNGHNCLLYSAAMVLDCSVDELIEEIGHDGMDVIWSTLIPPLCFRGHHIQEIIDCFVARGFGLMLVEKICYQAPVEHVQAIKTFQHPEERFLHHIEGREAILIGRHKQKQQGHAWAWDGETCYDPNGFLAKLDDYEIREAWIKTAIV